MKTFNNLLEESKKLVDEIQVTAEEKGSEKLEQAKDYLEDELNMLQVIYAEMKARGIATKEATEELFADFYNGIKSRMRKLMAWCTELWDKFIALFTNKSFS